MRRALAIAAVALLAVSAGCRRDSGKDPRIHAVTHDDRPREAKQEDPAPMTEQVVKTDAEWREILTPEQYRVTRKAGTERAYTGACWNETRPGLYRCVCCGQVLFKSGAKYKSGTGWPSFFEPVAEDRITTRPDRSLFTVRTEVRSRHADSHLGHVFPDGPPPKGLRYCMNSAALRFIPVEDLEKEGYGQFLGDFKKD
jgi:methionine-R-sulfoxide reductase